MNDKLKKTIDDYFGSLTPEEVVADLEKLGVVFEEDKIVYDSDDVFCFCCEKKLESAVKDGSAWDMPSGGVILDGGGNFGSTLYDGFMDGIFIRLIICDECLEEKRGLLRERRRD